METKVCSICKKEKSVSEFNLRKDTQKDGKVKYRYLSSCKICTRKKGREYYYKNLKSEKGVEYIYRFLDYDDNVIYIGKTTDLKVRMKSHFARKSHLPNECYDLLKKIQFIRVYSQTLRDLKEIYYINLYKPKYNNEYKYDEHPIIIKSLGEDEWNDVPLSVKTLKEMNFKQIENVNCVKIRSIFCRKRSNKYHVYLEYKDLTKDKVIQKSMGVFDIEENAQKLVRHLRENKENSGVIRSDNINGNFYREKFYTF
ncbi:MAG: GIY-YIG nuclease family protein [Clostridia bacterium]